MNLWKNAKRFLSGRLIKLGNKNHDSINEWDGEENTPEGLDTGLVMNGSILPMYETSSSQIGAFAVSDSWQYYTNSISTSSVLDGHVSFLDANDMSRSEITITPNPEQDISININHNEPISVRVDRELYDIELFDDRIEIRRKFDNESNDNGIHPIAPEHSIQRSEDVLLEYNSE